MKFSEFIESKMWKTIMKYMYGFGASLVIIGALFKIQHWEGAGLMLILGLSVEAIIFAVSSFEPLHEEYDWTLVYPELGGMTTLDNEEPKQLSATEQLDLMLEEAKIGPDLINRLGDGMKNLSDTANKMNNISDSTLAANEFASTLKNASGSVENLSQTYSNVSQELHASNNELKKSYQKATEALSSLNLAADDGKVYADELNSVSKNLGALNSIYELQIQRANKQFESSDKLFSGIGELTQNLTSSLDDTRKYKDEISKLAFNLEALNNVYGNMLTADGKVYADELNTVSKNLAALNSIYAMQIQRASKQFESSEKLFSGIGELTQNLTSSLDDTRKYKDEITKLAVSLEALNNVYGNMLTAMNVRTGSRQ
jgi:gliding motility-associated protein GldL